MNSNAQPTPRYVVISPVRDEAEYLEQTIRSMVQQTIRPLQWILVDDGSCDGTGALIDKWASDQPWITAVHRLDRGRREPGTGVIESFYDGYGKVAVEDWEFVVKLDGDLSFNKHYFAQCFAEFEKDASLGIGGGVICHRVAGKLEVEQNPRFHVRGANKIYRRRCWQSIGGLMRAPGWDTIDEIKANMLNWSTRSFPDLQVTHHRFTGAATGGWKNAVKNGLGSYITGYDPVFIIARAINRLFDPPWLVGSIGMLYGFAQGYLRKVRRIDDADLIRYVRQQQLRRLLFLPSIWK
jgi:poly-beta-1,6-N-acetyl-D-glucosamine synthase